MSNQAILSRISSLQRQVQTLQRKLTSQSKSEADKAGRIAQIKRSITKSTSQSSLQNKLREIQRLETDLVRIQETKAGINKHIAEKTADLHKQEQQLYAEQGKEQQRLVDALRRKEQEDVTHQQHTFSEIRTLFQDSRPTVKPEEVALSQPDYDAFISHASEDKDDLVRPLAEALQQAGFLVWYDEFQLKVGDNLRRSIDRGLVRSRFGIVVLSPSFFAKNWPQYELDGLVAREMMGGKVVLPIWHKVSKDEVMRYSPSLTDKVALSTSMNTVEELARKLGDVLREAK